MRVKGLTVVVLAAVLFSFSAWSQETDKWPASPYPEIGKQPEASGSQSSSPLSGLLTAVAISGGVGTEYGGLGANLDLRVNEWFAITAGVGNSNSMTMAVGGVRLLYTNPDALKGLDFSIALLTGQVGILEEEDYYGHTSESAASGWAVSLDTDYYFQDNLFIKIGLCVVNSTDEDVENPTQVTFAAGLGIKFDVPEPEPASLRR